MAGNTEVSAAPCNFYTIGLHLLHIIVLAHTLKDLGRSDRDGTRSNHGRQYAFIITSVLDRDFSGANATNPSGLILVFMRKAGLVLPLEVR